MRAGKLRQRITIEQEVFPTSVDASDNSTGLGGDVAMAIGEPIIGNGLMDGEGGYESQWQPVWENIAASVEPLLGRERLFAGQMEMSMSHRVRIRARDNVTADMRINFRGRILNIRSVATLNEVRREMELMCDEGVTT